jgi:hypothetical protein
MAQRARGNGKAPPTEGEQQTHLETITKLYLGLLKAEPRTHVADQEPMDGGRGRQTNEDVGSGLLGKRDRE